MVRRINTIGRGSANVVDVRGKRRHFRRRQDVVDALEELPGLIRIARVISLNSLSEWCNGEAIRANTLSVAHKSTNKPLLRRIPKGPCSELARVSKAPSTREMRWRERRTRSHIEVTTKQVETLGTSMSTQSMSPLASCPHSAIGNELLGPLHRQIGVALRVLNHIGKVSVDELHAI